MKSRRKENYDFLFSSRVRLIVRRLSFCNYYNSKKCGQLFNRLSRTHDSSKVKSFSIVDSAYRVSYGYAPPTSLQSLTRAWTLNKSISTISTRANWTIPIMWSGATTRTASEQENKKQNKIRKFYLAYESSNLNRVDRCVNGVLFDFDHDCVCSVVADNGMFPMIWRWAILNAAHTHTHSCTITILIVIIIFIWYEAIWGYVTTTLMPLSCCDLVNRIRSHTQLLLFRFEIARVSFRVVCCNTCATTISHRQVRKVISKRRNDSISMCTSVLCLFGV